MGRKHPRTPAGRVLAPYRVGCAVGAQEELGGPGGDLVVETTTIRIDSAKCESQKECLA